MAPVGIKCAERKNTFAKFGGGGENFVRGGEGGKKRESTKTRAGVCGNWHQDLFNKRGEIGAKKWGEFYLRGGGGVGGERRPV